MNLNKNIFEEQWEQIRVQTKAWWSLFTEDDLKKVDKSPIKLDKYAMMLRMKYGFSHERAREEINRRIAGLNANLPAPRDTAAASGARSVRTKKAKSVSSDSRELG